MNTRIDKINRLVELEKQNDSISKVKADLMSGYNRKDRVEVGVDEFFNDDLYSKKTKMVDLGLKFDKHLFIRTLNDQYFNNKVEIDKLLKELYGDDKDDVI